MRTIGGRSLNDSIQDDPAATLDAGGDPMASLILKGSRKGQRVTLRVDRTVLGRERTCDVVLNDEFLQVQERKRGSISRKQAVITCVNGKYFVEDGDGATTASRNGTFLNDQRLVFLNRLELRDRDRIRICDFTFIFIEDDRELVSVEASLSHETSLADMKSQSAEKLNIVLEITNSLSNTFEIDAIHYRIMDGLFELFVQAERCFLITRETPTSPMNVLARSRNDSDEIEASFSNTIVRRCFEKVEAVLGNDLSKQFPESDSVLDLTSRSIMCAPLWSQNREPVGAIQLDTSDNAVKFTEQDLKLFLGVAGQASIALGSARMHRDILVLRERERDLEVAHQVQRALLPQSLPVVPNYRFFAHYEAAQQIGGDYYDFIPLSENRLAILLGDVVGKGIPAALLMAKFSVEARVCLESQPDLAAAITRLNVIMSRSTLADRFITLVAIVLDRATHTATIVNAGHPSPLLVRNASRQVEEAAPVSASGLPISVSDSSTYTSRQVELLPGDELLLFSDGVTEAMDSREQMFGMKGVNGVIANARNEPKSLGEQIINAVKRHAQGHHQSDDTTLVTVARLIDG